MYEREVEKLKAKMDKNPVFAGNVMTAYRAAMEADPKREVYESKLWGWFMYIVNTEGGREADEMCAFLENYPD